MPRSLGLTITTDRLRELLSGLGVTYQPTGAPVFRLMLDSTVTRTVIDGLLAEQGVTDFLDTARTRSPEAALPSEPTAHRNTTETDAERIRVQREDDTGFAHVKWEDGGAWMIAPMLPPQRVGDDV